MRNERARNPRGYTERAIDTRPLLERFLIVCEGKETEPNYFRSFRVPREVIDVRGVGDNTVGVVEKALELSAEAEYDQVWVVFDRDSFPTRRFNEALSLAQDNDIQVAYSNEAFELWYLLHFHFFNTAITRQAYIKQLDKLLGHKYKKGSTTIYYELLHLQPNALKHAQKLMEYYSPADPANDNPSTTVFKLVKELNRFLL